METTTYHRPIDQRPTTGIAGWLAIALGTVVLSVPMDLFITLVFTSSCGQPADAETVLYGRVALLVVALLAALPWLIAVPLSRNGGRGALIGMVAVLPALAFVVYGFTPGAWVSSLCLGG